jgi:hypothetical protein
MADRMPDLDMMKTAALKKEYAKVWLHKPLGQKANNDEWLIKKILEKRPLWAGKTGLTGQRGKTGLTGKTGPAGKSSSLQVHLHMHQTDSPGQEAEQIHAKSRKQETYGKTSKGVRSRTDKLNEKLTVAAECSDESQRAMKFAIAQNDAYNVSTKNLADHRQKLQHAEKLTATAKEEHEDAGVKLGTLKNSVLGTEIVEQKLQERANKKHNLKETNALREATTKSMQDPEYLAIAQQVSATLMERDLLFAALEYQRKNVKELQGVEAQILAVQRKALETSIKYEEKSDKIIRELKLMNDSATMDLMADGGFADPEDSGDDSGVDGENEAPPAYRPPPFAPPSAPPFNPGGGGGGYTASQFYDQHGRMTPPPFGSDQFQNLTAHPPGYFQNPLPAAATYPPAAASRYTYPASDPGPGPPQQRDWNTRGGWDQYVAPATSGSSAGSFVSASGQDAAGQDAAGARARPQVSEPAPKRGRPSLHQQAAMTGHQGTWPEGFGL